MDEVNYNILYEELEDDLPQGHSKNGKSPTNHEMLKVTLWKFCGNSLDIQNSWASGISESAIKSTVEKVIITMNSRFIKKYLRPPTCREAKKEALAFHNISGYPPIPYAAMDGYQIQVITKKMMKSIYVLALAGTGIHPST